MPQIRIETSDEFEHERVVASIREGDAFMQWERTMQRRSSDTRITGVENRDAPAPIQDDGEPSLRPPLGTAARALATKEQLRLPATAKSLEE